MNDPLIIHSKVVNNRGLASSLFQWNVLHAKDIEFGDPVPSGCFHIEDPFQPHHNTHFDSMEHKSRIGSGCCCRGHAKEYHPVDSE